MIINYTTQNMRETRCTTLPVVCWSASHTLPPPLYPTPPHTPLPPHLWVAGVHTYWAPFIACREHSMLLLRAFLGATLGRVANRYRDGRWCYVCTFRVTLTRANYLIFLKGNINIFDVGCGD